MPRENPLPTTRRRLLPTLLVAVVVAVSLFAVPGLAGASPAPCDPRGDSTDAARHYVCTLYFVFLHSPADDEVAYWMGVLSASDTHTVSQGIIGSLESANHYVERAYNAILARSADSGGEAYFSDLLQSGATLEQVEIALAASQELQSSMPDNSSWVGNLYQAVLDRTASSDETSYWAGLIANGTLTREGAANAIVHSDEATTVAVTNLYFFLGRSPDADGAAYWTGVINSVGVRVATISFFSTSEAFTNSTVPVN